MKKGFTLIELLAVIVILAIILVIAVPQILKVIENSRQSAVELDAKIIQRELERLRVTDNIDVGALTVEDLPDLGVKAEYTEFKAFMANDEVQVTLGNDKYTASTYIAKVYGVSWAGGTNPMVRTDDAVGMTYTVGSSTITSDFDNADIYKDIKEVTDTYGNVFMSIPKFYIKKTVNGDAWTWQISNIKVDEGYYLPACFYDFENNKELPYVLVGKYNASLNGTKLESKSGVLPQVNTTITEFRNYARNNNSGSIQGYQLLDIHVVDVLQTLFYVEFATLDSQSVMAGYTNGSNAVISGTTNSVSTASGSPTSNTSGAYAMKYRGIENLYGNIWQFVDGININNNVAYVSTNSNTYQSDKFDVDYKAIGYTNATTDGWVNKMGYDSKNPFVNLPIATSTTVNTTYKDYYYPDSGNRIALFGGFWSFGSYAGASFWIVDSTSTYAYHLFGSRLLKKLL